MSTLTLEPGSSVGVFDAKTHLSELLALVENGEEITITRHGKAVAKLIPAGQSEHHQTRAKWAALLESTKGTSLEPGQTTKDLIEEGRRI